MNLPFQTVKKVVSQKIVHKKFSGRTRTAKPSWNQKAVDSKGKAFGRVPTGAKSFAFIRIRKGDTTARWAVVSQPVKEVAKRRLFWYNGEEVRDWLLYTSRCV